MSVKALLIPANDVDFEDWSHITNKNVIEKTFDSNAQFTLRKVKRVYFEKTQIRVDTLMNIAKDEVVEVDGIQYVVLKKEIETEP